MRLLTTLMAGVRGGENGTAEICIRGTSTYAALYGDFEGTASLSSAPVALDAYGAAEVYVDAVVDVLVKTSAGAELRPKWTEGDSAPGMEVRSQSFTGQNYVTGESGAGEPTTAQAAFDSIYDSFGATDGKVWYDGSAQDLKDVLALLNQTLFNVKDYGAEGDGVTNDGPAFQAAIDAAAAAGGGTVVVPGGSYELGATTIDLEATVSLIGLGRRPTLFFSGTAVAVAAKTGCGPLENVWLYRSTGNDSSNPLVDAEGAMDVICDCELGYELGSYSATLVRLAGAFTGSITRNHFRVSNAYEYGVYTNSADAFPRIICNRFNNTDGQHNYDNVYVTNAVVAGNVFDNQYTSGATTNKGNVRVTLGTVIGNHFGPCAGHAPTDFWNVKLDSAYGVEAANVFDTYYTNETPAPSQCVRHAISYADDMSRGCALTRGQSFWMYDDASGSDFTMPTRDYAQCEVTKTNGGAQTITLEECLPGCELTVIVHNSSGGVTGSISFNAAEMIYDPMTPFTVNDNTYTIVHMKSIRVNDRVGWHIYDYEGSVAEP